MKLGADDYLAKPFETLELLARIEALLRRGQAGAMASTRQKIEPSPGRPRFIVTVHGLGYRFDG